jgi:hypothetical protein
MSKTKQYGYGSFVAGVVLAILFGVLSANSSGSNQTAYIAACVVCAVAGVVGLLVGIFAS